MKIPNCERAVIDIIKLRGYSLNPTHPRGQHKARVFAAALGLTADDAEELRQVLLSKVCDDGALLDEQDEYGQRYHLDFKMVRGSKEAILRSCWIIRTNEDFPRLTNCYVLTKGGEE